MTLPETTAAPRHRLTGWRRWVARAVVAVAAPTLVVVLLEAILRLAGYGLPTTFFVPSPDGRFLLLNDKFSRQFAPKEIAPSGHPLRMAAVKKPGTFRIFILGESAAMGTPEPAFGFGRILQAMLREQYPGTEFEVVNCGMTAINSHIILPIAQEAAGHEGDLYIVYMGNNEVTGPFGPGTIYKQYTPSRTLIRASVRVKRTRTGQLIGNLLGGQKTPLKEWKGMENWAANRVAHDDPRREGVYSHFAANLADILDAVTDDGARAIVCTLGVNLKDCPPFASLHRAGLDPARQAEWEKLYAAGVAAEEKGNHAEALAAYRKAMEIDGAFADLRYRMGRCLFAGGDWAGALAEFSAARDLDALQFRPDARLQAIIRQTAQAMAGRGVALADVDAAFCASPLSEKGIPGRALLWEHVHMTFEGNYLIARTLLPRVTEALPQALRQSAKGEPPDMKRCAELLCYTASEQAQCADLIHGMMARPPFTGQIDHGRRLKELVAWMRKLPVTPETLAESIALHERAIQRDPEDWELRITYSLVLCNAGRAQPAREQLEQATRLMPGIEEKTRRSRARLLLLEGKDDDAIKAYEELIRNEGELVEFRNNLASAHAHKGNIEEAERCLRRSLELEPDNLTALTNLGGVLLSKGDAVGAEAELRKALAVFEQCRTHLTLGKVLRRQGKREEAMKHFRRAAALEPGNAAPRFSIATLLMDAGDGNGAYRELRATVALDPRHGQAHALLAERLMMINRMPTDETMYHMRSAWEAGVKSHDLLCTYSWFLAAHPSSSLRDGDRALKVAQQACDTGDNPSAMALRSLAAAHAEKGDFGEAVKVARRGREAAIKANQGSLAQLLADEAALYESRRTTYQRR